MKRNILPRDIQQDEPIARCSKCDGEIYYGHDHHLNDMTLCDDCYEEFSEWFELMNSDVMDRED